MSNQDLTLHKTYTLFRFLLALILVSMFYIDQSIELQGNYQRSLFFYTAIIYLAITSLHFITKALATKEDSNARSPIVAISTDIFSIITMSYIAGSTGSSLNTLLLIPVAASAIFFPPLIATLFAAITSMALLGINIYTALEQEIFKSSAFVTTGFLGAIFFATSFLVQFLTKRIKANQDTVLEQQLEINSLQRLNQHIVERLRTGILVFNVDGKIALSNKTATHLLGDHFHYNRYIQGELLARFKQWQKQGSNYHSTPFQQSSNLPEVTVNFLKNQQDQHSDEFIAFIEDHSEVNQQAQQFKLASLGRLSASIAHEIRNPLSAIAHSAQLLQEDEEFDLAENRLIEIINNNTQRVESIITNVLSISKRQQPNLSRTSLLTEIKKITNGFQEGVKKNLDIDLIGDSSIETIFDQSHLNQVITNLIDNAMRYSFENTEKHYVKILVTEDTNQQPIIQVYDIGKGVPEKHIDKLFEPFFTTSNSGTGLGLFICRELCELNFAKLSYIDIDKKHYFQIRCAHAGKKIS